MDDDCSINIGCITFIPYASEKFSKQGRRTFLHGSSNHNALDYLTFGNRKHYWISIMGALLVIVAVKGFGKVQLTPAALTSKA